MIRSIKDINDAMAAGRVHTSYFLKNAGSTQAGQWEDWAYASGKPAIDPRLGTALEFTPQVAVRNDAIFFPSISAGMERRLIGLRNRIAPGGTGQTSVDSIVYDLLGVYPLIDGDSNDSQVMDNTQTLPRYTDGNGVKAVLVNHIAPGVTANEPIVINYRGTDDVDRNMTVWSSLAGINKASFNLSNTASPTLYLPNESNGVKRINSLQFTGTAPGGLWCIYLLVPLETIENRVGVTAAAATASVFTEKCLCTQASFDLPRVYDGAHLGIFYMPAGTARSVTMFGTMTFIWG